MHRDVTLIDKKDTNPVRKHAISNRYTSNTYRTSRQEKLHIYDEPTQTSQRKLL